MIYLYSQLQQGTNWLRRYANHSPTLACILGFTATALIKNISAAGSTPKEREYTAIADAEFLASGIQSCYQRPLPILTHGLSPTFITRAMVEALRLPVQIFNAGLLHQPSVATIDLGGIPANCLTTGRAMPLDTVRHLFDRGWQWGKKLAATNDYVLIGECVVGGTTTAMAVLTALGIEARQLVSSSLQKCDRDFKWSVVKTGLSAADLLTAPNSVDPLAVIAAVGDPMQAVAAGMAIAASQNTGVMLAGGTQMLAVYASIQAIASYYDLAMVADNIVVGTTRWVVEDLTGDAISLAKIIDGVPLLATGLNFATSKYPGFRAYERGYVKEGVGAGGCAIAAHLKQSWTPTQLLTIVETLFARYQNLRMNAIG
ncbi:nicotinate mononucleotide-dependent phosphoribosyltransferase CobT [Myxosarcina sp. GI1]|uniref:nicotinate mononucleotide-dependent phosphoribosyltransferase CobT n=1 Tax=Myxosarcina sp. GI1 TaxID=1541065 RepID=UPI00056BFEA9|nr:TIGR00303 family protein [Myxosarcina sp. GI1]